MYTKHSVAVLTSIILGTCSFSASAAVDENICQLIGGPPTVELLAPNPPRVIFEDQDRIIAYHGSSCAESNQPGEEKVLRVEEKLEIPPYAAEATVFLNGWLVQYSGGDDHHIRAFGTAISKIRLEGKTLKWQAAGVLRDRNFDDSYRWCYSYTAIAWNPAFIQLAVDHKDGSCDPGDPVDPRQTNFFSADNGAATTALSSFSTFIQNPNFASSKTVAILPRGFEFTWSDKTDHHLLQTAYSLDHSETFVETDKRYRKGLNEAITPFPGSVPRLSLVGSGAVSWETSAIFKDNDTRRDYVFGEIVSGLGGDDVGVVQPPPFSVLPHEDVGFFGACSQKGTKTGDQTEDFVIDSIPFEYAIPMLTGWDLEYACDDEHVARMGIGIDTWGYDKNTRTLRYTLSSILRDKNSRPGFLHRHKVTVLGIKRVAGAPPIP